MKYDTDAPEEFIEDTLECLAKAFSLLIPQSHDEEFHFLAILENAYMFTDYGIKEVIDRIYANKSDVRVREPSG